MDIIKNKALRERLKAWLHMNPTPTRQVSKACKVSYSHFLRWKNHEDYCFGDLSLRRIEIFLDEREHEKL